MKPNLNAWSNTHYSVERDLESLPIVKLILNLYGFRILSDVNTIPVLKLIITGPDSDPNPRLELILNPYWSWYLA